MIWRWEVINEWLKKDLLTPKLGLEIGVKEGRFTSYMLANNQKLEMICIDPYELQNNGNEDYKEWDFNEIQNQFHKATAQYSERVTAIRAYSEDVDHLIKDHSLDFCFIDAQHDYSSVKNDILLYKDKIKPGGLLCGHDYNTFKFIGVVDAVNELCPGFITGENDVWGLWL